MRPPGEDPYTFLLLGQLEYEAGQLEHAVAAFERALELQDPKVQGAAAFGLGLVRLKQGHREGAYAAWRLAIATGDPEYAPRAACFLAVGYQQEGNRAEARKAWELALNTSSERYETIALLGLGSIADQDGEVALALGDRDHQGGGELVAVTGGGTSSLTPRRPAVSIWSRARGSNPRQGGGDHELNAVVHPAWGAPLDTATPSPRAQLEEMEPCPFTSSNSKLASATRSAWPKRSGDGCSRRLVEAGGTTCRRAPGSRGSCTRSPAGSSRRPRVPRTRQERGTDGTSTAWAAMTGGRLACLGQASRRRPKATAIHHRPPVRPGKEVTPAAWSLLVVGSLAGSALQSLPGPRGRHEH